MQVHYYQCPLASDVDVDNRYLQMGMGSELCFPYYANQGSRHIHPDHLHMPGNHERKGEILTSRLWLLRHYQTFPSQPLLQVHGVTMLVPLVLQFEPLLHSILRQARPVRNLQIW